MQITILFFKRLTLRVLYKLALFYWKITNPRSIGSRCLIVKNNQILLLRHSYMPDYYIPGGGIKKNETITEGIIRELKEEVGITVSIDDLMLFLIIESNLEYKQDTAFIFLVKNITKDQQINSHNHDKKEILEIKWFDLDNLPKDLSVTTNLVIKEYIKLRNNNLRTKSVKFKYVDRNNLNT